MRRLIMAAGVSWCIALGLSGPSWTAGSGPGPVATIRAFIDAFDKGDIAAAEATHQADVSIIDEMAPHEWHGPGAFRAWVDALGSSSKAAAQTEEKVVLGDPIRVQVDGETAYVIMAAHFQYKQNGAPTDEPAQMAFALKKGESGWKIAGWAWSGAMPRPMAAK